MRCIMAGMDLWCATTGASGFEVQKTVGSPQLHFYITVVDISFVAQRLFPMVLAIMEIPQWCVDQVIDVPVGGSMVQKLVIRSCSSSKIVDFLFVPQRQLPMVPPFRKTIEFLHLQYVDWCRCPYYAGRFPCPLLYDRRAWFRLCSSPWKLL